MSRSEFRCRSCGRAPTTPLLSMGTMPLANSYVKPEDADGPEERFPLDWVLCEHCALVQITETVPPEKLFKWYYYYSSFSDTMLAHSQSLADRLTRERQLGPDSLVMEIGSNDGYLLQYYVKNNVGVLGVDPAENIAKLAIERGVPTVMEFFGAEFAKRMAAQGKRADVLHANNVFAHMPDLNGVVEGIQTILKPDGAAIIEMPYVKDLIDNGEVDTIYHEHLCYYSAASLANLFARHGLAVYDVERIAIHGGSLRVFVGHKGARPAGTRLAELVAEEESWGVSRPDAYRAFVRRVETLKTDLVALLRELKAAGKRVAAYGAGAKGSTLLNYFGIGSELVEYVADRNTLKQGLCMPGTHQPICAPETLAKDRPDYCLLLTWNFAEEIMRQQAAYREQGGRFIIPIPKPVIV
ncbi:MAG: class I SAM-dependent methyltransferase [Myxococcales bacterium]|nr:MAG: class I SAM-dependent methyltransferase [Myxococcales bacterium]